MDSSSDRNNIAIAELVSLGRSLIRQADPASADRAVRRILNGFPTRPRRRRWVPLVAVAFLLLVSSVGLAAVADKAAPGDFFYSVDRGYERLGDLFGPRDRAQERMAEAADLIGRDHLPGALAALQEAAASQSQLAADELEAASVALAAAGAEGPSDRPALKQHVLDVLTAVQDLLAAGPESSQGSTRAIAAIERHVDAIRQIGALSPGNNPAVTAPGQTGNSPAVTAPGQTGNSPAVTAPGQTGNSPAVTAPGQIKDKDKDKSGGSDSSGGS